MKVLKTFYSRVQWCLDFEFFHGIRLKFLVKLTLNSFTEFDLILTEAQFGFFHGIRLKFPPEAQFGSIFFRNAQSLHCWHFCVASIKITY